MNIDLSIDGALLTKEEVPGVGRLSLPLTNDELQELAYLGIEAHLNSLGLERVEVRVADLRVGDILPDLGLTITGKRAISKVRTELTCNSKTSKIELGTDQLIRVNRIIR